MSSLFEDILWLIHNDIICCTYLKMKFLKLRGQKKRVLPVSYLYPRTASSKKPNVFKLSDVICLSD